MADTTLNADSRLRLFQNRPTILGTLKLFRKELALIAFYSTIANLLMLSPTIYMLQIYDRVMISRSEITLSAVSLIALILLSSLAFSEWVRSKLIVRIGLQLDLRLSDPLFRATFHHLLRGGSENPTQAFADLSTVRQWLTSQAVFAFFDAPWTIVYVTLMFMLHPFLGWVTIAFVLNLALLAWFSSRMIVGVKEEASEEEKEVNTFVHSKLRNAEVIEAHGMVGNLKRRWLARQRDAIAVHEKANETELRMNSLSREITLLKQSLALGAGAILVIDGELSIGAMIAANLLMSRATAPLDMMVSSWRSFMMARAAMRRVDAVLADAPPETTLGFQPPVYRTLELRSVTATALQRERPILDNISLKLLPGEVTAIVGPSGSGKSTLGKVILGIWPEARGQVLYCGQPITAINREQLGPTIGYLPQDFELFDASVADNIARMGAIDPEKMIAAARLAGVHDTILRLPGGYNAVLRSQNSFLSGGQRQLLALARAVYDSPSLLVLDEPNANIDEDGESALAQAITTLREKGASIVVITHQTGLLELADRVIGLKDGVIVRQINRNDQARIAPVKPTNLPDSQA
jgi:ATP-binding cassette subfamily C exporter for protease/lipase